MGQQSGCQTDVDQDGWEACSGSTEGCDCDDNDASVHPGATEVCNGLDDDCNAGSDDGLLGLDSGGAADSCLQIIQANSTVESGAYWLVTETEPEPFEAFCDMDSDGGGWTLMANYLSNLELFDFDFTRHQLQTSDSGQSVETPPRIWDDGTYGHMAYPTLSIEGRELRLACRSSAEAEWFSWARSDIFTDWTSGDHNDYGNADGWGILGDDTFGRSNHFICGAVVNTGIYEGIGYCQGNGASGSWTNHRVSFSFTQSDSNYGGGLSVGCNGTGINYGKDGHWEAQMWIR